MTPTEAAKVMRAWGEVLSGAAEPLEMIGDATDRQAVLEQRCIDLKSKLDGIIAETDKERQAQDDAKVAYRADTNTLIANRKDAFANVESAHMLSMSQAEKRQRELMDGLEQQRSVLKVEVDGLNAQKLSLAADVASLRALIADMAKK